MRRPLPPAVWIAVAALAVVVVLQVALALLFARSGQVGWGMYAFAALLWALLVGGLYRGARLAWLWARYMALILGGVVTAAVVLGFLRHEVAPTVLALSLLGLSLPLFAAGLALGRASAYAFFDLVCRTCGARTGLGADFLFRQARCRKCKAVW